MTFSEYVNQVNPKRHPNVYVFLEDVVQTFETGNGEWCINLLIFGTIHSYLKVKDDNQLYTMDKHGNKKARSVFEWQGAPIERVPWRFIEEPKSENKN